MERKGRKKLLSVHTTMNSGKQQGGECNILARTTLEPQKSSHSMSHAGSTASSLDKEEAGRNLPREQAVEKVVKKQLGRLTG